MSAVPAELFPDETARLAALHELQLLDSPPEAVYDDIVQLASQICGTPTALVSLVGAERQWFKACIGMDQRETHRDLAFCAHAILTPETVLIVEDTWLDSRFRLNPLVTGSPHIRFYAGAPILTNGGHALGTICVIDTVPRRLDAAQIGALRALSRQTTALLELRLRTLDAERQVQALERLSEQTAEVHRHERRRTEQALALSEHRLNLALSRTGLWVFDWDLTADRVYRGANFSLTRGGPAQENVCSIAELQAQVYPDDMPTVRAAVRGAITGQTDGYDFEYRVRGHDGAYIWMRAAGRVTERGPRGEALRIIGTEEDVSATKAAEQALVDSQHRLRMITDNLPALIAYIDHEQRYQFLNARIATVFGTDVEAAIGRTMRETRGDDIYQQIRPHAEAALRGVPATFTYTAYIEGREACHQANYVPDVDAAGNVVGFYAMTFDITPLNETQRQLESLARVDPLTGLPNRRQFDERITEVLLRSCRLQQTSAVMFLDIDRFKGINDVFGHAGGDAVLSEFARRLRASVRATDTVARLAGDEFVVLLEAVHDRAELEALAQKIVASVREPFEIESGPVDVTTSVGVAICLACASTAAQVLARADAALYQAKSQGRDRYAID